MRTSLCVQTIFFFGEDQEELNGFGKALNFRFRWISVGVFEMCEHHFSVSAT